MEFCNDNIKPYKIIGLYRKGYTDNNTGEVTTRFYVELGLAVEAGAGKGYITTKCGISEDLFSRFLDAVENKKTNIKASISIQQYKGIKYSKLDCFEFAWEYNPLFWYPMENFDWWKGENALLYLKDKNKRICFRLSSDMVDSLEAAYQRDTQGTISKSDYIRNIIKAYVKKNEYLKAH